MSELRVELSVCKLASSCCWAQEQRILALLLSLDWQYDAADSVLLLLAGFLQQYG